MDVGYLTRTIAPNKCLNSVHLLMGISMIAVIGGGIWDVRKNQNSEMRRLLAGFVCFAFFGILSIVQYRFSRVSNYPMYCCIGLLIFMLFIIWAAYDKLYRVMDHNANVQAYRRLAYRDVMTGLGNRAAFMKDQEELPEDSMVGFVVMDINDLKHTNDQYGHQAGDEMICNVASCIEEVFRGHGRVYRIGGDEFVAIVRDVTEKLMDGLLGTLDQALEKKQQEQERPWKLRIAYGYAIQPTAAEAKNDYEELFKQADDRMYERKRRMKS
jgi:diguanylate cyclase (GGDEF)-like protein